MRKGKRELFAKEGKEGMDLQIDAITIGSFLPRTHFCELVLSHSELARKLTGNRIRLVELLDRGAEVLSFQDPSFHRLSPSDRPTLESGIIGASNILAASESITGN